MKFKLLLLSSVFTLVTTDFAIANQLNVNGSIAITQDETYSGNVNATRPLGSGVYSNLVTGILDTNGYNITSTGNTIGLDVNNAGIMTINGSGSNYINTSGNNTHGMFITGTNSELNINNMNVEVNGNRDGIYSRFGGIINITGNTDGKNALYVNNNSGYGLIQDSGTLGGSLNVKNMDLYFSGNARSVASHGSTASLSITGVATGVNKMVIKDGNIGIIASSGANLNIKDMNIFLYNNPEGIVSYSSPSSKINITGVADGSNSIVINGSSREALNVRDGATLDISNMDISILDAGYGIFTRRSKLDIKGIASRNNLSIKNSTNSYALYTEHMGGKIAIENMNISSENTSFANIISKAGLSLINSDVFQVGTGSAIKSEGGNIDVSFTDVNFYNSSDSLLFVTEGLNDNDTPSNSGDDFIEAGNSTFTATSATRKTLQGSIVTDIATSSVSTVNFTNIDWDMKSASNITNLTMNNTNINLRGNGYNTLMVDNMNATGTSDLYFNTYFDGGVSTDKIVVNGGTMNSNGTVYVTSKGTDGSQSDVMLIDLDNASGSTGVYSLYGNVVDSGAYEYELNKVGNNWLLQSNGRASGTARMIASAPSIHYSIIRTGQNELRKRLGSLRTNTNNQKNGTWVRTYAKDMEVSENSESKMNLYGLEAGYDHLLYGDCDNKFYGGVMAGYLYTDKIKSKVKTSGTAGSTATASTPSVGAYATWVNVDGWFADATFREFFSDMDIDSTTSQNQQISYSSKRNFHSASLEFGKEFSKYIDSNSKFVFEPKVEAQYFVSKAKDFKTKEFGDTLSYGKTQSIATRGAFLAGYKKRLSNNSIVEPFVEVGYSQEWDGKTDVKYAGGDFNSDLSGGTYDIGTGIHLKMDNNLSFYGDITYENGSVIKAVSGNIGARVTW